MALSKPNQKKDKLPLYTKTLIDWKSPDNACRKLLVDISSSGIKYEDVDIESIRDVYIFFN
jgi:hypothetical protein